MHNLHDKLIKVHDRLQKTAEQARRDPASVKLLAVSKTQPVAAIRELFGFGQHCFGENYLQEALQKQAQLADLEIEWHFIGPIQSNKTRDIAAHFAWVHSVDRLKIAKRLNDQRPPQLGPLNVCIEVNVDLESSKSGVHLGEELESLATAIMDLPRLRLRGLMAIPAPTDNWNEQLAGFKKVAQALTALQQKLLPAAKDNDNSVLNTLSMGMSADLEAAIATGATIVRVGTDIFGPRKYNRSV